MADNETESIEVNVKKKVDEAPKRASRDGSYLGPQADETDDKSTEGQGPSANHQGKVIQPSQSAKDEAETETNTDTDSDSETDSEIDTEEKPDQPDNQTEATAVTLNTPPPPEGETAGAGGQSTATDTESAEPTLDQQATQQHQALVDNRDYKISKKQLKKAPQKSGRHAHKTWVFLTLVTLVSIGLAYVYLTAVEGMSLGEITTKLGL